MLQNKIVQNAKWIIAGKLVQSLMQFVIGMISARYLGPSNYGILNYAASVAAFAMPLAQLGMRATLVQEYIADPEKEGEILGTSCVISMLSAFFCLVGVTAFAAVANHNDKETIVVCGLYGISIIFQTSELMYCWFQARLLSQHSTVASLISYFTLCVYRLYLLISQKNVYFFALAHSFEYLILGILFIRAYRNNAGKKLAFSGSMARMLLAKSKYYILAELMVTAFQNTDHIMLQMISGEASNGYYTAAVTCVCMTGFVYNAILDSVRPVVLVNRGKSLEVFERSMSGLYGLVIYMAVAQSVLFALLAEPIVWVIYGSAYLPAILVLKIDVWMLAFSCMGSVRNVWILAEEKHSLLWVINLCGVVANILLNAVMIPIWGASGAAIASVITQFVTNFVVGFCIKPLRRNNILLLQGLNPRYIRYVLAGT